MKYIIILFFTILILQEDTFSQSANQNFNKYWFYRDRLKKRFMVQGSLPGQSLVAENVYERTDFNTNQRVYYQGYADQTINMGWYLGVLGTEYYLLSNNGQITTNIQKELYDAIKAFERLDFDAEQMSEYKNVNTYNGCGLNLAPKNINGFFQRSDIGGNLTGYGFTWIGFDNDLAPTLNKQIFCNKKNLVLNSFEEDPVINSTGIPVGCIGVPDEMSQDQAYRILMGLALIYKYVPVNETYNGMNFHLKAQGLAFNIINWIKNSHLLADPAKKYQAGTPIIPQSKWYTFLKTINWDNTTPWTIVSPTTNLSVNRGPWCQPYSYGLAHCNKFFGGTLNHDLFSQTEGKLLFQCMAYTNGVGVATAALKSDDECFADIVAAIGSCWKSYPATIASFVTTGIPLPSTGIPFTQQELDLRTNLNGMQFYALLHASLHNKNTLISQNVYRGQLDAAPACGPFNSFEPIYKVGVQPPKVDYYVTTPDLNGNTNDVIGWNVYNRFNFYDSERQVAKEQSEFNGLDYMLYFNLYNRPLS